MIKKKFYIHTSCTLLETWEVRAENKKDAQRVLNKLEADSIVLVYIS